MAEAGALDRTIIYTTDNALEPRLERVCRAYLLRAAGSLPIVSVSQKPIDLGRNICVGEIGRNPHSLYVQLLRGLEAATTPWVVIAEHDCIYSIEHLWFTPADETRFWYNDNVWFLQYENPNHPEYDGMYSHTKLRRVQSQLVCNRLRLIEAIEHLLLILGDPAWLKRYPLGRIGEPGCMDLRKSLRLASRAPVRHLYWKVKDYITGYRAADFITKVPNIDIRHKGNFTGPRRGKQRRWSLEPWGSMEEVLNGA